MSAPFPAVPSGSSDDAVSVGEKSERSASHRFSAPIRNVLRPFQRLAHKLSSNSNEKERHSESVEVPTASENPKQKKQKKVRVVQHEVEENEAENAIHENLHPSSFSASLNDQPMASSVAAASIPPLFRAAHRQLPAAFYAPLEDEQEEIEKVHSAIGGDQSSAHQIQARGLLPSTSALVVETKEAPDAFLISSVPEHPQFTCEWAKCNRDFHSEAEFQQHGDEHLATQNITNFCLWRSCDFVKPFSTLRAMKKHVRAVHLEIRDFHCDVCQKKFTRKDNLQDHMNMHTNERPAKCTYVGCGGAFRSNSDLRKHQESTHEAKKKYKCPVVECPKDYTDLSALRKHMNRKHGEEAYKEAKKQRKMSGERFNYGQIVTATVESKQVRSSSRHRPLAGTYITPLVLVGRSRNHSGDSTTTSGEELPTTRSRRSQSTPAKARGRAASRSRKRAAAGDPRLNPVDEEGASGSSMANAPYTPEMGGNPTTFNPPFALQQNTGEQLSFGGYKPAGEYTTVFNQSHPPYGPSFHSNMNKMGPSIEEMEVQERSGESEELIDVVGGPSPQKLPPITFGTLPAVSYAFDAFQPPAFSFQQHPTAYGTQYPNSFYTPALHRAFEYESNEFADIADFNSGGSFGFPPPTTAYQALYNFPYDHTRSNY